MRTRILILSPLSQNNFWELNVVKKTNDFPMNWSWDVETESQYVSVKEIEYYFLTDVRMIGDDALYLRKISFVVL